ncbi:PD-(D/E)XK motif protein [Rhizobium leguminosarum]|uniref:PD-(D/E)XK motif protein n=1 Tax=Rhizobium leguminosarum TaxID=384 RepID=UPI0013D8F39B|nr:PD-(D/E)XK motif protein [Rhizobium leguminosarum]MBY5314360.1 PD-(D/E)XK motif protein [Rhizobium leguminosarum]NEH53466.1 PD-(D/E)XK motif protein [Rhizobium leguminosarum]
MSGWTEEGLARAWRALARQEAGEDWRFVHLTRMGAVSVEAGCHFPMGREALIVSFPGSWPVNPARLPEGKGFDVSVIAGQVVFDGKTAVALIRRPEGSPELFGIMVVDVLRTLEAAASTANRNVMEAFLERVKEWQAFMARTHRPLSSDAQVGLLGELWLLRLLADSSLGAAALDCWQGPLRAAQDFHVYSGAIEVKSTVRTGAFLARINSVEQLDSDRAPIFLCALRFEENTDGVSLVDIVSALRERFAQAGVQRGFEALLMVVGYLHEHAPLYGRTLTLKDAKAFPSEGDMPRLTRAALPAAVRSATYVLDLDALEVPSVGLSELLNTFGLD